jgi:hypothetical protein
MQGLLFYCQREENDLKAFHKGTGRHIELQVQQSVYFFFIPLVSATLCLFKPPATLCKGGLV